MREKIIELLKENPMSPRDLERKLSALGFRSTFEVINKLIGDGFIIHRKNLLIVK